MRLSDGLFVIDNVNGHIFVPQTINHLIIIACPLICIIMAQKILLILILQWSILLTSRKALFPSLDPLLEYNSRTAWPKV